MKKTKLIKIALKIWYNNMDDSIENSLELSRQIYEKDKIN